MRPQRWLFVANLLIQPPLLALFVWMATGAESTGERIFGGVFAAIAVLLLGILGARARAHDGEGLRDPRRGRRDHVPNPLRGTSDRVAFAAVERAVLQETRTTTTSFWMLRIDHGTPAKSVVVTSQMIGPEAFDRVKAVLVERGVELR